jgi:hypothetical protein
MDRQFVEDFEESDDDMEDYGANGGDASSSEDDEPRDQFFGAPFRPKTFRINFHPQNLRKFSSKKQLLSIYLRIMDNNLVF